MQKTTETQESNHRDEKENVPSNHGIDVVEPYREPTDKRQARSWITLDAWLAGSFQWPSDEPAQLFLTTLLNRAEARIANEHVHILQACLESNLPALLVLSVLTHKLSAAGGHAQLSLQRMDFDPSDGWRFRVDSCTGGQTHAPGVDIVQEFLDFAVAFVTTQVAHPTVACDRVLRWMLSAPWFQRYAPAGTIFNKLSANENDHEGGPLHAFLDTMFEYCEALDTNVVSDATYLSACRFHLRDNTPREVVGRINAVPISACLANETEATRMCFYACCAALPGARMPLTSEYVDGYEWKALLDNPRRGHFYAAAFNPVLQDGVMCADIVFYGPLQCLTTPDWLDRAADAHLELWRWLPYPLPLESANPRAPLCSTWMKSRVATGDCASSSADATRDQARRAYGFPADTHLVEAQCKAVFDCLQPKGPSQLDCLVLGGPNRRRAPPPLPSDALTTLPLSTRVLVRERHTRPDGMVQRPGKEKVTTSTISPVRWRDLQTAVHTERSRLRTLLKMPTGAGKTLVALTLLCHTLGEPGIQPDRPVVVIVPTLVLANQMVASIRQFTKLEALILADPKISAEPTHHLEYHAKGKHRTRPLLLAHLAGMKKVLVLVTGFVCRAVLHPQASVSPWFLILDEVQELIARPRTGAVKANKLRPLLYMEQLIAHEVESTHLLLLCATPEAVLPQIACLLSPVEVLTCRRFPLVQQAFLDRHTCHQYVPPRRAYHWTHELVVTTMAPHRPLYTRLRDTQTEFVSSEHDTDNLRLVVAILHRCGQRADSVLQENLTSLLEQLLSEPRRVRASPGDATHTLRSFSASNTELNAWLNAQWAGAPFPLPESAVPPHASSASDLQCPICMEPLVAHQTVQMTCTHLICTRCFCEWAKAQAHMNRNAPLCPLDNQPVSNLTQPAWAPTDLAARPREQEASAPAPRHKTAGRDYSQVKADVRGLLDTMRTQAIDLAPPQNNRKKRTRDADDAGRSDDQATDRPEPMLLPAPFSAHSKATALLQTLHQHPARRAVLFCCPEELAYYEQIAQNAAWTTTRRVDDFQRDADLRLILLPHAEASGANLDGASLLIRISIDSCDPGQATQQRGRLTRHTQQQDLIEVVIVSPGWEYMMWQLQQQNEAQVQASPSAEYFAPSVRQLCMTLFHRLRVGNQLGLRPIDNDPTRSPMPSSDPLFPVIQLMTALHLQIDREVTLVFIPPYRVLLRRLDRLPGTAQSGEAEEPERGHTTQRVAALSFNLRSHRFMVRLETSTIKNQTGAALIRLANVACTGTVHPKGDAPSPQSFCCHHAQKWFLDHLFTPVR